MHLVPCRILYRSGTIIQFSLLNLPPKRGIGRLLDPGNALDMTLRAVRIGNNPSGKRFGVCWAVGPGRVLATLSARTLSTGPDIERRDDEQKRKDS